MGYNLGSINPVLTDTSRTSIYSVCGSEYAGDVVYEMERTNLK